MNAGRKHNRFTTHCPRGHQYTPENTKLTKSTKEGHFKRQCRQCKSDAEMRSRARDRLVKFAMRCDDPYAPFPVDTSDGATDFAVQMELQEQSLAINLFHLRSKLKRCTLQTPACVTRRGTVEPSVMTASVIAAGRTRSPDPVSSGL